MGGKVKSLSILLVILCTLFLTTSISKASDFKKDTQGKTTITVSVINTSEESKAEEDLSIDKKDLNDSVLARHFPKTGQSKAMLGNSIAGFILMGIAYSILNKQSKKFEKSEEN